MWFGDDAGNVIRFDAATGHQLHEHTYNGKAILAARVGDGKCWLATASGPTGSFAGGELIPITLANDRSGAPVSVGGAPSDLALVGADVYVGLSGGGIVPYHDGIVYPTIDTAGPVNSIVTGEGYLWVVVGVPD